MRLSQGDDPALDAAVERLAGDLLSAGGQATSPDVQVRHALAAAGCTIRDEPLTALPGQGLDAALLVRDELSKAGDHAEALIDMAAGALRPGGWLLATALNAVHATITGRVPAGARTFRARDLGGLLGNRGFALEVLCAPGAAARLRGDASAFDPELDREPGLVDVAPRLLAIARAPADEAARSRVFFATLPRKVVAAAVLCRDEAGRILLVYDRYRQMWTIPGGVVDSGEDPRSGAVREAWEEAGVRVQADALLGVFNGSHPDRVVFVYAAHTRDAGAPTPVHTHEIGAAEWVDEDEAIARVSPSTRFRLRRCLEAPGGTWVQGM